MKVCITEKTYKNKNMVLYVRIKDLKQRTKKKTETRFSLKYVGYAWEKFDDIFFWIEFYY